jgi:hypothetical protein
MWALEVRPVAPYPAVAGIWRLDHPGLRRVFRDGAGSDLRCSRPASLPSRGVAVRRAASSLPTPLCVRSFRVVRLRRVSATSPSVSSGLPLLGLSKVLFRAPRLLLSEAGPSPVLPWVQGRDPGGCAWRLRAPVSGSPSVAQTAALECSPLHRLQRCAAALPWSRWPPLPAGSSCPAASREGDAQPGCPGAGDATPSAPTSRPRRFSRPRRCDRTRSVVPRRFSVPPVRRVSATSHLLASARSPGLSPVPAGVSAGPRLAGVPPTPPKVPVRSPAADPGVHRVSGSCPPGGRAARRRSPEGLSPSPRCTPAPRSLHSLPLLPLTCAAIPPLARLRSPGSDLRSRLPRSSRVRTPLSSLVPRSGCSCLARLYAFASQGPLGHPDPLPVAAALARCVVWSRSAARLRAAVVSPRPQGTSAGSGPACRSRARPKTVALAGFRCAPWACAHAWSGPFASSVGTTRAPS